MKLRWWLVFLVACHAPASSTPRRADVLGALARVLEHEYVFPALGAKAAARVRAFDGGGDRRAFAEALTRLLQDTMHDKHVRVVAGPPPRRRAAAPAVFGDVHVQDGIGYAALESFDVPEADARAQVQAAMTKLATARAVVLDLRDNGGGYPETVALVASYLFAERVHLTSERYRDGRVEDRYTDPTVAPKLAVPVFVVTSARTFSGGEEFAYDLQARGRARVVGEQTGGGANPGGPHPLPDGFAVFVPDAETVNPVTHANWEGVGVTPDVRVPAQRAVDTALALARQASATGGTHP